MCFLKLKKYVNTFNVIHVNVTQVEDSKCIYLLNSWGEKSHYLIIREDEEYLCRNNGERLWEKVFIGVHRIAENVIPKVSPKN